MILNYYFLILSYQKYNLRLPCETNRRKIKIIIIQYFKI